MCDQTEIEYLDGEVVWVKLGSCWWPGEVVGFDKLPAGLLSSFRKPPIAVVKFFQEETFEYVKNISNIYKYNCSKKTEFIKKGLEQYRTKHGFMDKFPDDIVQAETITNGDPDILSNEEFQESKKESYAGIFGDAKKIQSPAGGGKRGRGAKLKQIESPKTATPTRKFSKGNSDYKATILVQPKTAAEAAAAATPSTSRASSEPLEDKPDKVERSAAAPPAHAPATPGTPSAGGQYACHSCNFSTTRLNVLILHNKSHSAGFMPYTPSPVRKKPAPKQTPKSSKTPKQRRPKADKVEKPKKTPSKKRQSEETASTEAKKAKTDDEIKSSLLADWDDAEESLEDEASQMAAASSPELPAAEPALPTSSAPPMEPNGDKPECSKDANYEFCEDEAWPVEDLGRKIPRVKNSKRKSESKSLSLDEEDVAKEVADLLSSTTVPELPSAPEPLKVEENFPERPIEKSPDKTEKIDVQPTKTIFKTKTFFRSRHSRSQDAIGKYVAEQLNAAERMISSECELSELNGAEAAPQSPAAAAPPSPVAEPVRVAKLAPKIQLKKMKAEAAQQLEREKAMTETATASEEHEDKSEQTTLNHNNPKKHDVLDSAPEASIASNDEKLVGTAEAASDNTERNEEEIAKHNKHVIESPVKSQPVDTYMNESTASAVDALLSVSRDPDRVTKNISNNVPEDMFEDDPKVETTENETGASTNMQVETLMSIEEPQDGKDTLTEDISKEMNGTGEKVESVVENAPAESVMQVAEALINLPSTAISNRSNENLLETFESEMNEEVISTSVEEIHTEEATKKKGDLVSEIVTSEETNRFESDQEKSENFNAAQCLVQMSEAVEMSVNNTTESKGEEVPAPPELSNNGTNESIEHKISLMSDDNKNEVSNGQTPKFETTPSKLLKILEEPCVPKPSPAKANLTTVIKKGVTALQGKEKILNFEVGGGSPVQQPKPQVTKQKIIIRRTTPSKTLINCLNEPVKQEKIILSRSKAVTDGSAVQTYTIQASPDATSENNTIIIQQKMKKVSPPKLQKIKPQSLITIASEPAPIVAPVPSEDALFDINSMPIVLSADDILTPENIEKMPIVMSDGNLVTSQVTPAAPAPTPIAPAPKPTKPRIIETQKHVINTSKSEMKTLLMSPMTEVSKSSTPNILSKSAKLRSAKPMLVIDKATGKQKLIMTKSEPLKQSQKLQNVGKTEKFIILPTANSSHQGRTQKIVIDPQSGKAHVLVAKEPAAALAPAESKPVSAKLLPPRDPAAAQAGGTVMIITNAQGTQSRIVLTPEHEKLLFPKKQQAAPQLKAIPQRALNAAKTQTIIAGPVAQSPVRAQTKIVPKQKSAIITSKGQLIVGGRVTTTPQNVTSALTEIRPAATKRIVAAEPRKIVQTIQKTNAEPLIFLQQKSGAVMQLTAAQFEHLQRTGQIVQKTTVAPKSLENKVIVQKSVTLTNTNTVPAVIQKQQRVRTARPNVESSSPAKKMKQEIIIKPAVTPMPSLTPIAKPATPPRTPTQATAVPAASSPYPDLDNLEEMLPSTAIARPEPAREPEPPPAPEQLPQLQPEPEPAAAPPPPAEAPEAAPPIADSQLMAVPGEHFGGLPGSFYLCLEDNGLYTPIDNRPLVLENNQLVPMVLEAPPQPERRDILEAALANSDVFHEPPRDEVPDFRDLNANVSVHCRVSETSTTLNQPIMTPVEVPSNADSEPSVPANLEDGLAVIGVTPHSVPTSLELPITVTDPRIAPKTSDPLCNTTFSTTLISATGAFAEEAPAQASISMPLLTEEEEEVGKSMPLLTEEAEARDGAWPRPLLTPGSDCSEASAEIPLQPHMHLTVNDLSGNS